MEQLRTECAQEGRSLPEAGRNDGGETQRLSVVWDCAPSQRKKTYILSPGHW